MKTQFSLSKTITAIITVTVVALFASVALFSGAPTVQAQWSPLPTPWPQPVVQFSSSVYSVNESAGAATIVVYLNTSTWQQISVNYTTYDGTATPYSDYTPVNGVLTFSSGETSKSFIVPIANDTTNESNKTINLQLSNPAYASLGTPSTAVLTIVDDDTPTQQASILGYHTVRSGETLFCIARAYSISPWAIATQNNLVYPYSLYTNQVLAIPNVPWLNPSAGDICPAQFGDNPIQPTPVPSQPGPCRYTHVVQRGDTLYSLARRYGSSVWSIASANHIANPNLIFVGQVLCIP